MVAVAAVLLIAYYYFKRHAIVKMLRGHLMQSLCNYSIQLCYLYSLSSKFDLYTNIFRSCLTTSAEEVMYSYVLPGVCLSVFLSLSVRLSVCQELHVKTTHDLDLHKNCTRDVALDKEVPGVPAH